MGLERFTVVIMNLRGKILYLFFYCKNEFILLRKNIINN